MSATQREGHVIFAETQWPAPLAVARWLLVYLGLVAFGWLVLDTGWASWFIGGFAWLYSLAQTNSLIRRVVVADGWLRNVPLPDVSAVEVLDAPGTKAKRREYRWFSPACLCPHWMRSSLSIRTRAAEGPQGTLLVGTRRPQMLLEAVTAHPATVTPEQDYILPDPVTLPFRSSDGLRLRWEIALIAGGLLFIVLGPLVRHGDWLASLLLSPLLGILALMAWRPIVVTPDMLRIRRIRIPLRDIRSARLAPMKEIVYLATLTDLRRRGKALANPVGATLGLVITVEGERGPYTALVGAKDVLGLAAALRSVRPELFSVREGRG